MVARLPIPIDGTPFMACPNESHKRAFRAKDGCPECPRELKAPVVERVPVKRAGQEAEDALCNLIAGNICDVYDFAGFLGDVEKIPTPWDCCVQQYPWGLALAQPRRFRSDFAFPFKRLLVEIEGGCHGIQRQRKSDILRTQLAEAAGYRVLRVLPEQCFDASAVECVRKALGRPEPGQGGG